MGNMRTSGVTVLILLISMMLIAVTVTSVLTDSSTGSVTEEDIDQMTQETIDEISSYLQIRDRKGKFYRIDNQFKINKIALMISPLVTQEINLSGLTVQVDNGKNINILTYSSNASSINSGSVFESSIWDNMTGYNFGLIMLTDKDNSIKEYNVINYYGDNAYLIFKLTDDLAMKKGDKIRVTLFPDTGITRTVILEAPLPMTSTITFE